MAVSTKTSLEQRLLSTRSKMPLATGRIRDRRGTLNKRTNLLSSYYLCCLFLAFGAVVLSFLILTLGTDDSTNATPSSTIPLTTLASNLSDKQKQQEQSISQPHNHDGAPPKDDDNNKPITIAYAISLIKCGDFQSSVPGMSDAAVVLRHSIHQTSVRNPASGSKYDYKVYAIVHAKAAHCAQPLADAGFALLVREPPVLKKDIRGEFLRKHIHREWCCGADEFIKLYAYTLEEDDHPLVVHVDVDFVFHQPMDDLFDAMLLPDTPRRREARNKVALERPNDPWPDKVDAVMTRDWGQVMPGRRALFQAGFLVTRPDQTVFDKIVDVIKEGNYVEGFSRENGWGGKGYGGLVGAMAAQGLLAYVYDIILPGTWMELNQCRYNHMGMDVLYRSQPSFRPGHAKRGKCRNDLEYCEDCMHTNVTKIFNIHFTQCRKPWNCIGIGDKEEGAGKESIPEDSVHLDHCMELISIWHSFRTDLENKLEKLTGDGTIRQGRIGDFKKNFFQGHCTGNGGKEYIQLSGKPETMKRIPELYRA